MTLIPFAVPIALAGMITVAITDGAAWLPVALLAWLLVCATGAAVQLVPVRS